MAIIRKRSFSKNGGDKPNEIALIDSADKLVRFAEMQNIQIFPLDVGAIAEKFNIEIDYVPLEDDGSGILYKEEGTDTWAMQINEEHHPNRQRYTIAHELGHFCLHRYFASSFEDKIFFRGGESSKMEWQANEFASEILMPEQKFRKLVRSGVRQVEALAKEFKVSTLALRIRAKNLGMSGHGT